MAIREQSELLRLLDQRFKELGLDKGKFKQPIWGPNDNDQQARAVALHSEAHKSDPFAGARMALHLRRGLDTAGEVIRAAQSLLAARHH